MKKIAIFAAVAAIVCSCTQKRDPASWVDVFIGTDSNIHCHPDATYPFGRLQPGPQGGNFDWDHSAGWHWGDTTLQGFNQNRMSGGVLLGIRC